MMTSKVSLRVGVAFNPCPHPPPDLSSLLAKLGLEKYEVNFAEEEVSVRACA